MDQAEYQEIHRMSNFFDYRISRVLNSQGTLSITTGVVLLGVHAGIGGLHGLYDRELGEGGCWKTGWFLSHWNKFISSFNLNLRHQAHICMFQLQVCEEQFLCWKWSYPPCSENHACCYVAGLPPCCWVQDVMVGDVVVLGVGLSTEGALIQEIHLFGE